MGEKSTSIERQPERDERRSRAGPDAAAPQPTMDLSMTLSALGNERVQRMLRERDPGARPPQPAGARVQRQEMEEEAFAPDPEEEGPQEIPPEVASAGMVAEMLLQGALASLQTKNLDDVPAALEMLESAEAAIQDVSATIQGLDNPLLLSQYHGLRQCIVVDVAAVMPHTGSLVPLDKVEEHMVISSMAFTSDFIAGAQGGG